MVKGTWNDESFDVIRPLDRKRWDAEMDYGGRGRQKRGVRRRIEDSNEAENDEARSG